MNKALIELRTHDFNEDMRYLGRIKNTWNRIREIKRKLSMLTCKLYIKVILNIVGHKITSMRRRSNKPLNDCSMK